MARTNRLVKLIAFLRDGRLHRARDLANAFEVSERTIYRDMDRLIKSGVPVQGTRGTGYQLADTITLPPLRLTPGELNALNLGLAIVAEAADPDLKETARALADRIDALLPVETIAEAESWKTALTPIADPARGLSHMASLRNAITGRQKLKLDYLDIDGTRSSHRIRPLRLGCIGHVWLLTAWSETGDQFRDFRLDLIETTTPLPELFTDEPGKRLSDIS